MMTVKWKDTKAHEQYLASQEHARVLPAVVSHLATEDGKPKGEMDILECVEVSVARESGGESE